jgi:glycosyltransferase involved in cell wall biosynthesis
VEADGFRAVPLPRWHGRIAGSVVMFEGSEWKYSSRRHSDVVVMRWSPRSLAQFPALMRARAEGVATVLWGHGYSKQERIWWRWLRNALGKQASANLFYDPQTRDAFIQAGWKPERLFVALNSIDHTEIEAACRWWQNHPHELASFRREHGLDVVLFVSRLQPANGVDLLIESIVPLSRGFPGVKVVILGNGAAERARLGAIARRERAGEHIVFVDGVYDEMKLAPWFLSAKLFCYPANVGLSLIHALWYGLPVVTGDKLESHNPEIVALEHGINGLMYPHGSREALVEALRTILSDESLRASMSQAARQKVEKRFTVSQMVDGMEAAIRFAHSRVAGATKTLPHVSRHGAEPSPLPVATKRSAEHESGGIIETRRAPKRAQVGWRMAAPFTSH